jgi:DNA-binding NarL/FixJ family response regulator
VAVSVLIVDDHTEFRAQARKVLELAGYDICGEAADAAEAIAATRNLHPDVLLLDVQLPDRDGFSVAEEIGNGDGAPQIVLISSREAADYGSRLEQSRTAGFIPKAELSRARLEALVGGP